MSDFLDGLYTGAWLHEAMEDRIRRPCPGSLGPMARFEFGPIRESWDFWRDREWLHRFGLDDAGSAARRALASSPPLGVTWRHPGEMEEASKSLWRRTSRAAQPLITVDPGFFGRLKRAVEASNTPDRIAAQNLQCRMAALHPTWSARPSLFFKP